ncbi:MAG: enoyl-CoA hydratase [Acidimicrobiales bacterium]
MPNDPVLLETSNGGVRTITLNRPDRRNSLSTELSVALFAALERADADDGVAVVVLTGSDPAFCAGVDLKEAASGGAAFFERFEGRCVTKVAEMSRPIIGAINGAAFTGGFEIALGCDFLVASERALFADTHARVGVLPGGGMTARLPSAVGLRQARMMSLTGDVVDARRAAALGLVVEVTPHGELMARAHQIAAAIAETKPEVIASVKRMYAAGSEATMGEALRIEREIARAQRPDFDGLAARRDAVMDRNRGQLRDR